MNTATAFMLGEANRGNPLMVFDWDKAAQIIKERRAKNASAGLSGDWEWTGGEILRDGKPVPADDTYTYLESTWAVPELKVDGEIVDCWCRNKAWDAETYWPQSALDILNGNAQLSPNTEKNDE